VALRALRFFKSAGLTSAQWEDLFLVLSQLGAEVQMVLGQISDSRIHQTSELGARIDRDLQFSSSKRSIHPC